MNVKGKISSLNTSANTAEVILIEYDNVVTAPVPLYRPSTSYAIGQFVVLAVFNNNDFNDSIVL